MAGGDRIGLVLFITQALNWIETRGFASRPHAEDETNANRYGEPGNNGPAWNRSRQSRKEQHDDAADANRKNHTKNAAEKRKRHCLKQKLANNVSASRPESY